MNKIKPLSPAQVCGSIDKFIPDVIFEAVNKLLIKECQNGYATILKKDILKEVKKLDKAMTLDKIFDNGWLDIESSYRRVGWDVIFDKPAYCESYDSFFEFKKK